MLIGKSQTLFDISYFWVLAGSNNSRYPKDKKAKKKEEAAERELSKVCN